MGQRYAHRNIVTQPRVCKIAVREGLQCSNHPEDHPAIFVIKGGWLEGLRFVVDHSGRPRRGLLHCHQAIIFGGAVEMLRYMHELGGGLDARTTKAAASWGDLDALRYARVKGAPWDFSTIEAAISRSSLACLQYANTHSCPSDPPYVVQSSTTERLHARSLVVLRYVCEQMNRALAVKVLEYTARGVARLAEFCPQSVEWQIVVYLGRKFRGALPRPLAEAVAVRRHRAVALAWVFWWAGHQSSRGGRRTRMRGKKERRILEGEAAVGGDEEWESKDADADAECKALWEAMAKVPKELRERIALEAHLIIL
jgi:hypothetical protein